MFRFSYLASVRSFIRFNKRVLRLVTVNERPFVKLFVSFLFLGFSAIIPDRDFRSVFRFRFSFRSFIGIRRFKRLEFRLEALFPFNKLKQVFASVKFDLGPN